ncbi:MAG TPA: hypothetical protein VNL71_03640, partial [Chloroflexota bacterium]|nr:hypothetical protein [Chloroflexota bacterium]
SGWQQLLTVRLQHAGQVVTDWLSWLPGWAVAGLLLLALLLLARHALRQVEAPTRDDGNADVVTVMAKGDPDEHRSA